MLGGDASQFRPKACLPDTNSLSAYRVDRLSRLELEGSAIQVRYQLLGKGADTSAIARFSRHELRPLIQESLASASSTITIDWPGFRDKRAPHIRDLIS